eukprot:2101208-Amphidinium_carterae.1
MFPGKCARTANTHTRFVYTYVDFGALSCGLVVWVCAAAHSINVHAASSSQEHCNQSFHQPMFERTVLATDSSEIAAFVA